MRSKRGEQGVVSSTLVVPLRGLSAEQAGGAGVHVEGGCDLEVEEEVGSKGAEEDGDGLRKGAQDVVRVPG